jgi:hypothetical protein
MVRRYARIAERRQGCPRIDPKAKDTTSRLARLLDERGATLAEIVVGSKRRDAFGSASGALHTEAG